MKEKLTLVHSINTAVPQKVQTMTKTLKKGLRVQDNHVWWKGEKVSKKRVLKQVPVTQCIALRTSTQEIEVSIIRNTVDIAMDFWSRCRGFESYGRGYKSLFSKKNEKITDALKQDWKHIIEDFDEIKDQQKTCPSSRPRSAVDSALDL